MIEITILVVWCDFLANQLIRGQLYKISPQCILEKGERLFTTLGAKRNRSGAQFLYRCQDLNKIKKEWQMALVHVHVCD